MIRLRVVSGGASRSIVPAGSLFAILRVGSVSDMIRAPASPISGSGTTKTSPTRALTRSARSRVSSTCCFWSSPTGT